MDAVSRRGRTAGKDPIETSGERVDPGIHRQLLYPGGKLLEEEYA
jgi:hypothetical protein